MTGVDRRVAHARGRCGSGYGRSRLGGGDDGAGQQGDRRQQEQPPPRSSVKAGREHSIRPLVSDYADQARFKPFAVLLTDGSQTSSLCSFCRRLLGPGPLSMPVSPGARPGSSTGAKRTRKREGGGSRHISVVPGMAGVRSAKTKEHGHDRRRTAGRHPSVSGRVFGGGAHRPAQACNRDQVARAADGHRQLAGRAAGDDAGPRAPLGDGLRLGPVRSETERPAELHDRDRRAGYPLHPRAFPAPGRAAADRHARMARLDHRAAEDHRAAHQPHGARRQRGGRVPPGDSLAAGLRVLRQADRHRLGPGPHRTGLGRADEAPRLHPVRGAGRRLGCGRHADDGHPGRTGVARHSLQHAWHRSSGHQRGSQARRPAATGPVR